MIIRRRHTANFTTIGNALFNDERLEADEMGVLAFLLSRPDDWEVRRPQLAKRFRVGRNSIKRIMLNCMCTGWIVAKRTRLTNGTFHTIYEVRDEPGPTLAPETVKAALSLVSSEAGEADSDDDMSMTDHPPDTGPPPTGEPEAADQLRQTRRGSSKEELLNTDSINPDSPNRVRGFADVRSTWPSEHILSTVTAENAYVSLNETDRGNCFSGLKPYLDDCKAQNRKVCDLTTFIRERRWERFVSKVTQTTFAMIKPGTPQWFRWREYKIVVGQSVALMDDWSRQNKAMQVPSEWPPAMPGRKRPAQLEIDLNEREHGEHMLSKISDALPASREVRIDDLFSDFANEDRGPWFVVHTEPQMEKKVHNRLNGERIGCFMPVERRTVRQRGNRTRLTYPPLLRAYVFVRFQWSGDRFSAVLDTPGVIDFLRLGGDHAFARAPAVIESALVARLARKEFDLAQACSRAAKGHSFTQGQKVEAADGPWQGFTGQIKRLLNQDRIEVEISSDGRIRTVQFPATMLEAV